MTPILVIAGQELRNGLRNRWILVSTAVLALLAAALALLGSAPTGTLGVPPLTVTTASLASLSVFLIPLMALLLAYDAIVGEAERGTLLLLLSYPIRWSHILLGKLLGHAAILAIAIAVGYGAAGLAVGLRGGAGPEAWAAFASLLATSWLLGVVFLAIGYLVSLMVRERSSAGGLAVLVWLVAVIVYDLALLGGLVASAGKVPPAVFAVVLLANPTDAFRLVNLLGFEGARLVAGLTGVGVEAGIGTGAALAALALWIVVPLAVAGWRFSRREA